MESYTSKYLAFAEQIINKYKKFGRYRLNAPLLIFVRQNTELFSSVMTAKNTWFQFHVNVLNNSLNKRIIPAGSGQLREIAGVLTQRVLKETRETLHKNLLHQSGQMLYDCVKRALNWNLLRESHRTSVNGEFGKFQVFHSISTIFENRETRPDQARKAERKLIRILSKDFFENMENINMFRSAVLGPEWNGQQRMRQQSSAAEWNKIYRFEQSSRRTEETIEQVRILKKQTDQEEELQQTKYQVENLKERITLQENLLKEFRKTITSEQILQPAQVDGIARTVMKKMEQKLHQEKLRRGLY